MKCWQGRGFPFRESGARRIGRRKSTVDGQRSTVKGQRSNASLRAAQLGLTTRRAAALVTYEAVRSASSIGGIIQACTGSREEYAEMNAIIHANVTPA